MAMYEVEVVQMVSATVIVEAADSEAAVEACYAQPVLKGILPEQVDIDPNDWVPMPDYVNGYDYSEGYRGVPREDMLDDFVTRVKG